MSDRLRILDFERCIFESYFIKNTLTLWNIFEIYSLSDESPTSGIAVAMCGGFWIDIDLETASFDCEIG